MKTFPTLYKKTSTGAIQQWSIEVHDHQMGGVIKSHYGQVGGAIQTASDIVTTGKNVGKKNATTALEQAVAEAEALWTGKKKKGYVESAEGAEDGERDAVITGGIDPMLAHHYMDVIYDLRKGCEKVTYVKSKDAKKIKFPCYGQPKLDGIRCIAMLRDGVCTLWTRTRKPILSCPHVAREVERLFAEFGDVDVDGELYNHDLKKDFEKIVSAVRQEAPTEDSLALVQYHVYDLAKASRHLPEAWPFSARSERLSLALETPSDIIKEVETVPLIEEEVIPTFERYCQAGYEGLMLRNVNSVYVGKRSYDLQKAKPFQDDEFEITGFTEGRGKLAGKLGTFVCKTKKGASFDAPMNGEQATLERLFKEGNANVGKLLTIRFQGYTGKNKVPRFPKGQDGVYGGHCVRDYE